MHPSGFNPRSKARGFSMTEVLVTMLVLSIGLLGVAGLQLTSLKSNQTSAMRSQATFLAYDIIDRMRANRDAALDGDYELGMGDDPVPGTRATNDLIAWRASLVRTLPKFVDDGGNVGNPDGSVRQVGDLFTVTVVWGDTVERVDDPNNPQAATGVRRQGQFVVRTRLSN